MLPVLTLCALLVFFGGFAAVTLSAGWSEAEDHAPVDDLGWRGEPAAAQPDPAGVGGVRQVEPRLPGWRHQVKL